LCFLAYKIINQRIIATTTQVNIFLLKMSCNQNQRTQNIPINWTTLNAPLVYFEFKEDSPFIGISEMRRSHKIKATPQSLLLHLKKAA